MTPRHLLLGCGLATAAALVAFGDSTPDDAIAEPAVRPATAAPAARAAGAATRKAEPAILRLLPREDLIGDGEDAFGGKEQTLFARQDWTPPPPPPAPLPPPPPPAAPPLPFTYLGKAVEAGTWEVYLARGDRTYIVRDRDVLDGSYRVDAIAPPVLTLTYLPLNQVQQLHIGAFD